MRKYYKKNLKFNQAVFEKKEKEEEFFSKLTDLKEELEHEKLKSKKMEVLFHCFTKVTDLLYIYKERNHRKRKKSFIEKRKN